MASRRSESPAKIHSAEEVKHELVYNFDKRAFKERRKLGTQAQRDIISYLDDRIPSKGDPLRFGKGLKADLTGLWRYRVRDCGIIHQIKDTEVLTLMVAVGHRRNIYE